MQDFIRYNTYVGDNEMGAGERLGEHMKKYNDVFVEWMHDEQGSVRKGKEKRNIWSQNDVNFQSCY